MSEPTPDEPAGATGEDSAELDYEHARDQLIEVVRELEAGGLALEQSLALWERGEHLAKVCERHLGRARERVEAALASVENTVEDTAEDSVRDSETPTVEAAEQNGK